MKLRKSKLLMGIFISSLVALTLQMQVFAKDYQDNPEVARGDVVASFQGVNPETGWLVFEGTRVGDIPGNLVIDRAA